MHQLHHLNNHREGDFNNGWAIDDASVAVWNAVLKKDRDQDGKFVYGAVTTRIYCRPSCPARNPHPRNLVIFLRPAEAERQGYTPCLRCRPNSLTNTEKSIEAVLNYIETHIDEVLTLDTLSYICDLSSHHLREKFKQIVGLSPKAFCDALRMALFKKRLRAGQSISSACYEAGFGSSRALYERTRRRLGMTPATYRQGGNGLGVRYGITDSGLGRVLTAFTKHGLCAVLVAEGDDALVGKLHEEFPNAHLNPESSARCKHTVRGCQHEDPLVSKLPMRLRLRIFEARVWKAFTMATLP